MSKIIIVLLLSSLALINAVPNITGMQLLNDGSYLLLNGNTPVARTQPGRVIQGPNGPVNTGNPQPVPAGADNLPRITWQYPNSNGGNVLYSGNNPVAVLPTGYVIVPPTNQG
ncbi:uncharacterized protein LOC128953679 [Oppia nitens]|uniref:uncharacterized protein LOC128953679 n=1 Tax=Oppia nitens TaxID=1686743 RepID=UPI0023DCC441|nr:uncharacterized protein LOC128953679 [Oppia nitens]